MYQTFNIPAPGAVYGSFAGSAASGTRTDHMEVGDNFYLYWDNKNGGYNNDHFYYAQAGVTPKTYYWRVSATDASGAGPWSAVRSFTTRATIQSGTVSAAGLPEQSGMPRISGAKLVRGDRGRLTVTYAVSAAAPGTSGHIGIYDMRGTRIRTVSNIDMSRGRHSVAIDGASLVPGRYLVRVQAAAIKGAMPVTVY